MPAGRLHLVRRPAPEEKGIAGIEDQLRLQRTHLLRRELVQIDLTRRLALVDAPFLLPGEMDHEHVIGIAMAAVRLAALLREEHHRIGEHAVVDCVDRRAHRVDRRIEEVEPFEHQRGAPGSGDPRGCSC